MDKEKISKKWEFKGDGRFTLSQPDRSRYLYFPLVNESGMMSTITPVLHGHITTGQNHFWMEPVSAETLHNHRGARNFWCLLNGKDVWSATGNSPEQSVDRLKPESVEKVSLEAGFLWHKVTRENKSLGIRSEIVNFVPSGGEQAELMKVTLTNIGESDLAITPTAAIPFYARSATDIRDHRHVTSLLHRIYTSGSGMEVFPTLSFDERGHKLNDTSYALVSRDEEGNPPVGFFPIVEDFIGDGGSLDWPEAVVLNREPHAVGETYTEGYEAVGALRYAETSLKPGESRSYYLAMIIGEDRTNLEAAAASYCSEHEFQALLARTEKFWQEKLSRFQVHTADEKFNQWMLWVTIQPYLRRYYGNSFLPHHDYGKGGRGWRDLWQDCLALLMMEPNEVRGLLVDNFAGVRSDGSNATIIGSKPGEFIADRNGISRVWMDHGVWPFLTTRLYIEQSGDFAFLLEDQAYFKDAQLKRAKALDSEWKPAAGTLLKDQAGETYQGTLLEHLLLQHLVPFFHVGEHNNILLEGADWNDGMDMATIKGESVTFTAQYGGNMRDIAALLEQWSGKGGPAQVALMEEMLMLLDTVGSAAAAVSYDSVSAKRELLDKYFNATGSRVSGRKVQVNVADLIADLRAKADWTAAHLRKQEWIENAAGHRWFNGYYDNDGAAVEGDNPLGVRMTLTGQVFPIMSGTATDEQVSDIVQAVDAYLLDPKIGYRLNSNFHGIQLNLGRCFGFAFGHKENGAMFSHMTVMYANALYQRGFTAKGHDVLQSIYNLASDYATSGIYPGVPEYINEKGQGMYHYLTGSASWYLLTVLTETFGVKGYGGDLALEPKLTAEQFNAEGRAAVTTRFADRTLYVELVNKERKDAGEYEVRSVKLNGQDAAYATIDGAAVLSRDLLLDLADEGTHRIEVTLA
ncbi:GH36-type glycosyl hydrolase domain-containing protein [Gorillibacterium massiliense]|uniref:GH36-type glycosyl hydrolase domain-containing protein n=1 Tax=Gorillibacterium massiliense TaxID=1280390 RepID=UPI0004B55A93|nr:cellobiose phosphorylase [Gorillibacterium massiliense]